VNFPSKSDITVHPTTGTVSLRGKDATLTRTQTVIFNKLMDQESSREELIELVWPTTKVSAKALDVHMCNLRKNLAPLGVTVALDGGFYRLEMYDVR